MGSAATISLSLLEQVLSVQTWSECSPDKLFPGPPRLATAWLCPAEVSLCQLQTLRETWSTSQTESAPSTSLQSAWGFSPRNGSPPCTLRPVLPGPTWLSSECQPSSPPRSTLSWSMTSMLVLALQLS